MSKYKYLITDVDNTLYDWISFYIPSFNAMVEKIAEISGVDLETLKASFKKTHQKHHSTEYTFAIQELDALNKIDGINTSAERFIKYLPAIKEFRKKRNELLTAYPHVKETLKLLKDSGIILIALSDSIMIPVSHRLRQLDIDQYFTAIFASEDPGVPKSTPTSLIKGLSEEDRSARTKLFQIPRDIRKPDPRTLKIVLSNLQISVDSVIYIGDSLSKDILLAKRCGVADVWARYGKNVNPDFYNQLLKITYWTQEDVDDESTLMEEVNKSTPKFTIDSFDELLEIFELKALSY